MSKTTQDRLDNALAIAKREGKELHVSSYEITYDPIINKKGKLPRHVQGEINDLFELIHDHPQQAIPRLLKLKAAYPKIPIIYNYLLAAYSRLGDQKASRELALENYRNNPEYLFAKINYAQFCLYDGDIEKIPDIFEQKYDLKMLYPKRTKFHVTEFAGFTGVICAYYSLIGHQETAKLLYNSLLDIAPDSDMALFAKGFVYPSLINKIRFLAKRQSRKTEAANAKEEKAPPSDSDFMA